MNKKNTKRFMKRIVATVTSASLLATLLPSGNTTGNTVAAASVPENIKAFTLDQVEIFDEYYSNAMYSDIDFLANFETDRMLSRFRETAGLDTKGTKPYNGWENSYIGGHCVGHWLTAAAQAVKATGDPTIADLLSTMIDGLKECQDALGTGFIFGAQIEDKNNVEKQFNIVEGKDSGENWVPWYNMHKVVDGLINTYKCTDNETALEVAKNLGTWIYNRTQTWNTGTQNRILSTEYGGMNDCLYELYALTGNTDYRDAAHMFDDPALYKKITGESEDTLAGRHANATIPKFLGALNRYKTLKATNELTVEDEEYLTYVEDFWNLVITEHSYATGGTSEMEHFRKDEVQDSVRSATNCESCCAHNLLRMSRELFMITGDVKYADYYETTLRNAIMGAIDANTGAFSYFTPMATGYFKFFGKTDPAENMFWCCTGTGMENYTKLGDSIYFYSDNAVIVNQYVASKLTWNEGNLILTQESDVTKSDEAKFTINTINGGSQNATIYLRIPEWISGNPYVTINGVSQTEFDTTNGYIALSGEWKNGDVITFKYPMTVQPMGLPDNNTVFAFRYGPTLLAAKLGTEKMDLSVGSNLTWAGANLSAPRFKVVGNESAEITFGYNETAVNILSSETLTINDSTLEQYMANIAGNLVKDETADTLTFKLTGTDADDNFTDGLTFVPFNTLNDERYGIYWYFSAMSQEELEATVLKNKEDGRFATSLIDSIQPGYGQYEKDALHDLQESNSVAATIEGGGSTRHADAGGHFSYNMVIDKAKTNFILCTFAKEDNGKTIKISIGDKVIATETLNYTGNDDFYKVYYEIPADVLTANVSDKTVTNDLGVSEIKSVVRIKFESNDSNASARLVGGVYTTRGFNNNATITAVTVNSPAENKVTNEADSFTIYVPEGTQTVKAKINIGDVNGLLYIDDLLVFDGKVQTFAVNGNNATYKFKVFGEDHTTSKEYTLNVVQGIPAPPVVNTPAPQPTAPTPTITDPAVLYQIDQTTVADISVYKSKSKTLTITYPAALKSALDTKAVTVTGITYASSNAKVAKVSNTGKVTGVKKGTANITVTVKLSTGNVITKTAKVTVKAPEIKITGKKTVKVGKSIKLKAKLYGAKGKVTWKVNKKKLATINAKTGKLKAKKAGKVKVTASSKKIKSTVTIKIKK